MGVLAEIFDVVREHATEAKESLTDLCEPLTEDLRYIWDELAAMYQGDDDEE